MVPGWSGGRPPGRRSGPSRAGRRGGTGAARRGRRRPRADPSRASRYTRWPAVRRACATSPRTRSRGPNAKCFRSPVAQQQVVEAVAGRRRRLRGRAKPSPGAPARCARRGGPRRSPVPLGTPDPLPGRLRDAASAAGLVDARPAAAPTLWRDGWISSMAWKRGLREHARDSRRRRPDLGVRGDARRRPRRRRAVRRPSTRATAGRRARRGHRHRAARDVAPTRRPMPATAARARAPGASRHDTNRGSPAGRRGGARPRRPTGARGRPDDPPRARPSRSTARPRWRRGSRHSAPWYAAAPASPPPPADPAPAPREPDAAALGDLVRLPAERVEHEVPRPDVADLAAAEAGLEVRDPGVGEAPQVVRRRARLPSSARIASHFRR